MWTFRSRKATELGQLVTVGFTVFQFLTCKPSSQTGVCADHLTAAHHGHRIPRITWSPPYGADTTDLGPRLSVFEVPLLNRCLCNPAGSDLPERAGTLRRCASVQPTDLCGAQSLGRLFLTTFSGNKPWLLVF